MRCPRYLGHCQNSRIWKKLPNCIRCTCSHSSRARWRMGWIWKILDVDDKQNRTFFNKFREIPRLNKAGDKSLIFVTLRERRSWHSATWERFPTLWNTVCQTMPSNKSLQQSQEKANEKSLGNSSTGTWLRRLKRKIMLHDLICFDFVIIKRKYKNSKLIKGFMSLKSSDDNRFTKALRHRVLGVWVWYVAVVSLQSRSFCRSVRHCSSTCARFPLQSSWLFFSC